MFRLIEPEPGRADVPAGYSAYVLRTDTVLYGGIEAIEIGADGRPVFRWGAELEAGARPPRFVGERSHVAIKAGSKIDSRVFDIEVPGWPGD